MKRKAPTMQHSAKVATGSVTMGKGKILEYFIEEDANLYRSELSNAFCACGSGGGCSGGYDRAMSR